MFHLAKLSVLSLTLSPVFAAVVPRCTPPAGWASDLEAYDTYHARYLALSCHTKHDTTFFDQCCHPLLSTETLESRLTECTPSPQSSPETSPYPSAEDLEDCDDSDDNLSDGLDGLDDSRGSLLSTRSVEDESTSASTLSDDEPLPQDRSADVVDNEGLNSASSSAKVAAKIFKGGFATYYYQHGVAGACGEVHADTDLIAAIDADRYGYTGVVSPLCGRKVRITNDDNHSSVTVTIADACPTCTNSNSIDLSETAFKKIAPLAKGIVPITWTFL